MGATTTCRRLRPPSPILTRSQSGASSISLPETSSSSSSATTATDTSKKLLMNRSLSTTRSSSRTLKSSEELTKKVNSKSLDSLSGSSDPFARFSQHGSPRNNTFARGVKSSIRSPSAWALSPGRPSACMTPPESPVSAANRAKNGGGVGVGGVLKYFRQKKSSSVQEEDYHKFRVLYNRLMHWRFVNARAEVAMSNMKINAEDKLFMVWLRILKMRNFVGEKQIRVRKLKHEIMLYQILSLQMPLLIDWSKIDAKNYEALSRVARKLHALSVRIPLVQGAKTDVMSIYEAMKTAIEVIDDIEEMIAKFQSQVETTAYLLTELTSTLDQEAMCLEEAQQSIALVSTLLARESSLRAQLIQAAPAF